jgi:AcrR family transcriptional regulator
MRAADRRRQLLEVAVDLFARRGFRGTTTAQLARAAGVTEPILYRHFENKLDLFVTLIEEVGREVIASWQESLEGVSDPRERLEILLAGNPATHERGRGVYRVIFQAMTELDGDADIAKALRRHISKLHAFLAEELAVLQKAGVVQRDESAEEIAWLLIHVAVGYGMISPLLSSTGAGAVSGGPKPTHGIQRLLADLVMA